MRAIEFPQEDMDDFEFKTFLRAISEILDIHYNVDFVDRDEDTGYVHYREPNAE